MIEIDNGIMDAAVLLEKIRTKVLEKNIDINSYRADDQRGERGEIGNDKIRAYLNSAKREYRTMDATWFYKEPEIINENPIKKIIKRIFRKGIYWFVKPLFERQAEFNGATTRAVGDLVKAYEELAKRMER